jgi:hypothetical protein
MRVYINPEALVLNQVSAIVRGGAGDHILFDTPLQNIPNGADQATIGQMLSAALAAAQQWADTNG